MALSIGILTTFPPTQCGLATFSSSLSTQLRRGGAVVSIVRVLDEALPPSPGESAQLVSGDDDSAARAVAALNACDVVIVQHEYGIYGGLDGDEVLDVMAELHVPVITVLHTVLAEPKPHQREVLARVVAFSDVVVTMTEAGRVRLLTGWGVPASSVVVIAHGAHDNPPDAAPAHNLRPVILTWGLLGPGKGIEWALEAMAELKDLTPLPLYRVVGQTHPRVLENFGEAYRNRLLADVRRLGIEDMVDFDAHYFDVPTLQAIIRGADVVLLPYDSLDQVTSGVLTEAVVAGRPVISTPFPHATELLATGAGILVPRGDPAAIAKALRTVLTEPAVAGAMAGEARRLAPASLWSAVAAEYAALATTLIAAASLPVAS